MRNKVAKKLKRIAPLIVLDIHQKAKAAFENDPESVDWASIPTVRQVYKHLKRQYVAGR